MTGKSILRVLVACSVVAMLLAALVGGSVHAQSPSPAVISSYTVKNIDGSDVTNDRLMAGATYTVSLEINVGVDLSDTKLRLSTPMSKVDDVYWRLLNNYPGVNTSTWQPGQSYIQFSIVKGVAQFTLKGSIPSDYTTEVLSNEDYLHFTMPISLVTLALGEGSEILEERSAQVADQAIVAYDQVLSEKKSLLQVASADPTYMGLAQDIITLAEDLSSKGYVEGAIDLLDTLPISSSGFPSLAQYQQLRAQKTNLLESAEIEARYAALADGIVAVADELSENGYVQSGIEVLDSLPSSAADFPAPVSENSFLIYLIVIIVLAVILIAFFALYLKGRSDGNFVRQQVDEEAGRLDVLLVRATKIDRQLAREVEQVKEQLERISGR